MISLPSALSFWFKSRSWATGILAVSVSVAAWSADEPKETKEPKETNEPKDSPKIELPVNRKVQPGDILIIVVVDEPELKTEAKVDAESKIEFPFLGSVDVKDKTTAEISKTIRSGLDPDWIINPQVIVNVGQYVERFVTVRGQVNRPGQVKLPVDKKMTLVQAISEAQDVTRLASRAKIQLSRKGQTKTYNREDLNRITDPELQVYVEPDDIITIPQGF